MTSDRDSTQSLPNLTPRMQTPGRDLGRDRNRDLILTRSLLASKAYLPPLTASLLS